jgi:ribosomal protein S18 acetylase RimI-like enzyme
MVSPVLSTEEIVSLADRNMAEFHEVQALGTRAGEAVKRDDVQLVASATHFPAGLFNCLQPVGPAPDAARARKWLHDALEFYTARERGFSVYARGARDQALVEASYALGMQLMGTSPGMVLDAPVAEPTPRSGMRIERVADVRGVSDFANTAAMAYTQMSLPEAVTHATFAEPERLLVPDLSLYVTYVDGVPAATVLTLLSHGIAGVYWVGTHPTMQRRGLADAITRRASNDAFERGAARVILQATPFGEPVYRRMGYREITRYTTLFLTRAQVAALASR